MAKGLHQTAPYPDKTEHHRESYSTRQNNFQQTTALTNQNVPFFTNYINLSHQLLPP
jgi:hypothetical protein